MHTSWVITNYTLCTVTIINTHIHTVPQSFTRLDFTGCTCTVPQRSRWDTYSLLLYAVIYVSFTSHLLHSHLKLHLHWLDSTHILSQVGLYSTQLITKDSGPVPFKPTFGEPLRLFFNFLRVLPAILQSAVEDRYTITLSVTGNFQYPVGLGRWESSKIWLRCLDDCYKSLGLNLSLCQYFYCFKTMS